MGPLVSTRRLARVPLSRQPPTPPAARQEARWQWQTTPLTWLRTRPSQGAVRHVPHPCEHRQGTCAERFVRSGGRFSGEGEGRKRQDPRLGPGGLLHRIVVYRMVDRGFTGIFTPVFTSGFTKVLFLTS